VFGSSGKERYPEIIVALDFEDRGGALGMVEELEGTVDFFKIGSRLFTAEGPEIVGRIKERGARVFLDLKFHDIPATVAGSVRVASNMGVDMMTLHASGGMGMMKAAAKAAGECGENKPLLVGVTVLTSLDDGDLAMLGGSRLETGELVVRMAVNAEKAGLDGVVASVREVGRIREKLSGDFIVVTPGIRPAGKEKDDQKRVATPAEAARAGSDYLVIGRAITAADSPLGAAEAIRRELEGN
jgi:orotidine-5'-phosphate decarboxylase